MDTKTFKLNIEGREIIAEIKNWAERANGEALVRYGDTSVLATCVMSKQAKEGMNFFPLTVDYQERYYASGKIYGSRYIRREGRPSDEAIINARLIDRSIRPLFPKELNREVQLIVTVLSWDGQNDPDILGLLAASLALSVSDIPWDGPLGVVRVGMINGKLVLNPTYKEREENKLDIVFAGCRENNEFLINMIEGDFDEIKEEIILKALKIGEPYLKKIISFQEEISKEIGKEKISIEPASSDPELEKEIKNFLKDRLEKTLYQDNDIEEVNKLKQELFYFIEGKYQAIEKTNYALDFFEKEIERIIHQNIIKHKKRPDGRKLDQIRKIYCKAGVLPRTHGSGLFCRGQTKALSILTLGGPGDQQLLEGMEIVGRKRFMHHYNFPPYSAGEIKPMRGPGRREIGHGMLAEKAILPLIPDIKQFPYTIRVVSEILSSNGSTSMASISSSCLALMDAGVPLKRPAAGIAVGLMQDNKGNYQILTDIQGPEDHHGDMDFKVAGTEEGVTAIQMDVKIKGITEEILERALKQGKKARLQILNSIKNVLPEPRKQLSPYAPKILTIQIDPEKIREVIGPGGRIINKIINETGATIDIEQSGLIYITSEKKESAQKAADWIQSITKEVEVGEIFQGKVKRILDFGAFVEILPGQEGLVHISQISPHHVNKVKDVLKIGDIVPVKVISIDEQGRINLSIKEVKSDFK